MWASDLGIKGSIPVPCWAFKDASGLWDKVDWIAVAFWYMENLAERAYENRYGPIHSFGFRLRDGTLNCGAMLGIVKIALFLEDGHRIYTRA